jgi:hypothetical protein
LEAERKSERFELIDPPRVPVTPESPNRPAIILLGIVFSMIVGIASVAVRESMDDSVQWSKDVIAVAGAPPMAIIPYIQSPSERNATRRRLMLLFFLVGTLVIGLLVTFHTRVQPLNIAVHEFLQGTGLVESVSEN